MGRRVRRAIRRVTRGVERAVRETVRGAERVVRGVGDVVGSVPVVGDVLGATGIVETPLMKQQEELERQEKARQEELARMQKEQEAEEKWAKEQAKYSQNIMGTQQKGIGSYGSSTDLSTVLTGEETDEQDELLKRMLKKK